MKTPLLSRLLIGSALALMVALGAVAMRVALPAHDAAVVPEPSAAPPASVWKSEPAPAVEPAPTIAAPPAPEAAEPGARSATPPADPPATPVARSVRTDDGACADDAAGSCTPGEREAKSATASRPTIARDAELSGSPRGGSSRGARGSDRHVSSGPMRMLGGAESTW